MKTCKVCKGELTTRGARVYCSRDCYFASQRGIKRFSEARSRIKEGIANGNKSLWTKERRRKASLAKSGRTLSESHRKKISLGNKGKSRTIEHRLALSRTLRAKRPENWDGGLRMHHKRIRKSLEYIEWRKSVFKRDDYTCRVCAARGGQIQADHIKPFAEYPELRFSIDNGRTLCVPCHKKTDTWGARPKPKKIIMP